MERFVFYVEKTDFGLSAFGKDVNAAASGNTLPEIKLNALGALNTLLSSQGHELAVEEQIVLEMLFDS